MNDNGMRGSTSVKSRADGPERLDFIGDRTERAPLAGPVSSGSVPPVQWHGTRQNCLVNVTAKAGAAWVQNSGVTCLALLVTINGDIHNPYVVQSISVPFSVDVLVDGVQVATLQHSLYAPAVLDPKGSDQWYLWRDEVDLDPVVLADLGRVTLQIDI
jgi:hypothetical protein